VERDALSNPDEKTQEYANHHVRLNSTGYLFEGCEYCMVGTRRKKTWTFLGIENGC
jgi:hypothetical protein